MHECHVLTLRTMQSCFAEDILGKQTVTFTRWFRYVRAACHNRFPENFWYNVMYFLDLLSHSFHINNLNIDHDSPKLTSSEGQSIGCSPVLLY